MSQWASDIKVALEMENNVTNTGNGTWGFTNVNSVPFSTTFKHDGAYSCGIPADRNADVISTGTIFDNIKTISFWAYNSGTYTDQRKTPYINRFGADCTLIDEFSGAYYLYASIPNNAISCPLIRDAWQNLGVTADGTNVKLYSNGTYYGQMTMARTLGTSNWVLFNMDGFFGLTNDRFSGFMDNIVMSTDVYSTFPIEPLAAPTGASRVITSKFVKSSFAGKMVGGAI